MKSLLPACLTVAALLSAQLALAQALPKPENTLKEFGLYGRLAPNCSTPLAEEPLRYVDRADGTEEQLRITTRKDGKVDLALFAPGKWNMNGQIFTGWSPRHYVIKSAKQLNANELEALIVSEEQLPSLYYVWEKKGGKFRLKSIRNMAGAYSVKNGVIDVPGLKREYPWLSACRDD